MPANTLNMETRSDFSASAIAHLNSPAGRAQTQHLAGMPADYLKRLQWAQKHGPTALAAFVVVQQERRERARNKFARAEQMFFTAEGLEQATGDAIAAYRAACFPADTPILDACCGIGNDALHLASRGPIMAVDSDKDTALCARANAAVRSDTVRFPLHILCADVTRLDLKRLADRGVGAAFFDPSRRTGQQSHDRRRARYAADYAPPLDWLHTLRQQFPFLAVKVSPAIDDAALQSYPEARLEFISHNGECKECVLWFGTDTAESVAATVLRDGQTPARMTPQTDAPPAITLPQAWLIEPDPAVIRAGLLPTFAAAANAALLHHGIAYLTAPAFAPTPFAAGYRILDWLPYHVRDVQKHLEQKHLRVTAIKKRGVELDPAELIKRIPGDRQSTTSAVLVLTRRSEKIIALVCEPALRFDTHTG